jgi:CheY-like chemotaxis protein
LIEIWNPTLGIEFLTIRIAIIDDDPVEAILLGEIAKDLGSHFEFVAFSTIDAFLECEINAFELAFLDRRLPPHNEFSETLPLLAEAGFSGRIVLMTAHDPGLQIPVYPFAIIGPVDKLDLLQIETLAPILENQVTPRQSTAG